MDGARPTRAKRWYGRTWAACSLLFVGCSEARTSSTPTSSSTGSEIDSTSDAAESQGSGDSHGPTEGSGSDDSDGAGSLLDLPETTCTVTITQSERSPSIPTVGIVSFATNLGELAAAEIHFGLDTGYGFVAPVDLAREGHRTLLLGMKENRTYHFRVVVSDGISVCFGADQTIETGTLGTRPLEEAWTSEGAAPGFIVTSRNGEALILDKDGDIVWAFDMAKVFSVRMSWDGHDMLGRDAGPFDAGNQGIFYRVAMDGSQFHEFDAPGGDHHDFTVVPSGVAYLAKTTSGDCDRVYEASLEFVDGRPVFDTWEIYQYFPDAGVVGGNERCHANRIHYSAETDVYTISDRNKDAIAVFTRTGEPFLSIGKAPTGAWRKHILVDSAGPGEDWHVQHGHHFYADDKLVVFSNNSRGGTGILHYTFFGDRAILDWKYDGAGPSAIQGDVQHLPNGNFLITASDSGTIVELAPDGRTEVGRYSLGGIEGRAASFHYAWHRPTLYGPPPAR